MEPKFLKQISEDNCHIFTLKKSLYKLEDNSEAERVTINSKDWVSAIVKLRDFAKEFVMVKQYRNPLERQTIEIPAGKLDSRDEDPKTAAERELAEETGYVCDNIEYLTTIYTTVAFCNEKIGLYLARGLKDRHPQHLDDDEYIDLEAVSLDDALKMIYDGKIQDAKTVIGILMYASKYRA